MRQKKLMNLCTEAIEIVLYDFSLNEELFQRMTKDMRRGIKTNCKSILHFVSWCPSLWSFILSRCLDVSVSILVVQSIVQDAKPLPITVAFLLLFRAVKWAMTHIGGDVGVHPRTDKGQWWGKEPWKRKPKLSWQQKLWHWGEWGSLDSHHKPLPGSFQKFLPDPAKSGKIDPGIPGCVI